MIGLWNTEDFSQLLEGDPTALSVRAADLKVQAVAISEAAQVLQNIVAGQMSEATTELREMAAKLQTSMSQANIRYDQTGTALSTYAVALAPIKSQASADIPALEEARGRLRTAEYASGDAERRQIFETLTNSPDDVKQDTADDLARAQRKERAAQADIDQILARLRAGVSSKDEAASAAIRAIENVIAEGADSMLDNIAQFFEGFGNLLATIGQWAADFIQGVLDTLSDIWNALIPKLMAALVLALIPLVLGAVGYLLGGPLGAVVLASLGALLAAGIAGALIGRVLTDVTAPDPVVSEFEVDPKRVPVAPSRSDFPDGAEGDEAYFQALKIWMNQVAVFSGRTSLDNAFAEAGLVDDLGGTSDQDGQGVIKIEKVVGPDDVTRWRVVLPSTQDWLLGQSGLLDAGATNDLDSNLALMLTPELQTQYERAVMQAMKDAGIPSGPNGDPVMLVGFSQGGIMAGHLAANRSDAYNFQQVVACGAPIDAMRIPETTDVVSVQHQGDPVPMLDVLTNGLPGLPSLPAPITGGLLGGAAQPQMSTHPDNWKTFTPVAPGHDPALIDAGAHNAGLYNLSWKEQMANLSPEEIAELELFYAQDGATTTSEYYTWSE